MQHIPTEWWNKGIPFTTFNQLSSNLLKEGKTTGNDHSEAMLEYAKLNESRQRKWLKIGKLNEATEQVVTSLKRKINILVITEAWCGDSGQNLPFIHLIADANPDKIELRVVLRDEDTSIIDQFLTNGGRAIPKAVIFDAESNEILSVWGPRPQPALSILENYKANQDSMTKEEFQTELHTWYAKNKGEALQKEFVETLKTL